MNAEIFKKISIAKRNYMLAKHLYKSVRTFLNQSNFDQEFNDCNKCFKETKVTEYYNRFKDAERTFFELNKIV